MKVMLNNDSQNYLRKINLINNQEVVYKFGDLFIAENSVTGARRQLQEIPESIIESVSKPTLLKG